MVDLNIYASRIRKNSKQWVCLKICKRSQTKITCYTVCSSTGTDTFILRLRDIYFTDTHI